MASTFDRVALIKTEAIKGVDALPLEADAIQILSAEVTPSQEAIDRNVVKPTMGMKPHAQGKRTLEFKIVAELKGSGALGVASELSPLLQACYLTETVNAGVSVVYSPTTRNAKSCTIKLYKDGLLWTGLGAIGNATIQANVGESIRIEFTLKTLYTDPVAMVVPAAPVFDTTGPVVVSNLDIVTENAGTILTGSMSLDLGNQLAEHYTTSQHEFTVANRAPVYSITKDSVSTAAEWNALKNGDTAIINGVFGQTAGNIVDIASPNCVRETVGYSEREEKDVLDVAYRAYESALTGDDQFSITIR